ASPAARIPAAERLLLASLLASAEARGLVLPRLAASNTAERLHTRSILQAFIAAAGDAESFPYSEVEARLGETDRAILSSLVFADEMSEPGKAAEQALECLRELENSDPKARIHSIQEQIRAAERAGNTDEARDLMSELQELKRGVRAAGRGVN